MKVFECQKCEFELKAKNLPEDYICPDCGADRSYFVEKEKNRKLTFYMI